MIIIETFYNKHCKIHPSLFAEIIMIMINNERVLFFRSRLIWDGARSWRRIPGCTREDVLCSTTDFRKYYTQCDRCESCRKEKCRVVKEGICEGEYYVEMG